MKSPRIFLIVLFTLFAAAPVFAMTGKPKASADITPAETAQDFTPEPEPEQPAPVVEAPAPQPQPKPDASLQKTVLENFIAWDTNLKTLSLDYTQYTTFEGMDISSSEGRIYKKGNNIRLDTLANGKVSQTALTDKKTIRILDDKGKLITALSWQEWQNSQANKALFDFGNYAALLSTHRAREFTRIKDGYKIVFVPLEGAVYELEFLLGPDYFPTEISISSDGVNTRTILSNISKNTDLKESLFK